MKSEHTCMGIRRVAFWGLVATALLVGPTGCGVPGPEGPADSFGIDFTMPTEAKTRGAVLFVVDGLSSRVFARMLDEGKLPNFQKYFIDRGLYVENAVGSTPSVTLANMTSIVTGQFPGHHGVTGINWFDRNRLIWRNYETIAQKNTLDNDYQAATIYEQFPDEMTFSCFLQNHRGATKFYENRTSAGPAYFFGLYELTDRIALYRLGQVMDIARARKRFPIFTTVYMLATDFRAYDHGVTSAEYGQALLHTDRQIGRVLGDMERAGLLEKIVIGVVSDHSLDDVTQHFHLTDFFDDEVGLRVGRKTLWENTTFEKRFAYYRKYSVVLYGSGWRYWGICLRKPNGDDPDMPYQPWMRRPTVADLEAYPTSKGPTNLIEKLIAQPAIEVVAYTPGLDQARVRLAGGEVEFRQPGGQGGPISYHVISGDDPLGWAGKVPAALLDGKPHSQREWFEATAPTDHPDLPAQIVAYFRAPRAADLAVFAAPGWDFNSTVKAGHGGLRPGDMLTPLMLAGPNVPHRRIGYARTVDLMPTILKLFDKPIPPGLDGQPLLP